MTTKYPRPLPGNIYFPWLLPILQLFAVFAFIFFSLRFDRNNSTQGIGLTELLVRIIRYLIHFKSGICIPSKFEGTRRWFTAIFAQKDILYNKFYVIFVSI